VGGGRRGAGKRGLFASEKAPLHNY